MRSLAAAFLLLAACSEQKSEQPTAAPTSPAPVLPATDAQSQAALMLPLPTDGAELDRLLAMGYQAHDDHLHAPGVTACPKMNENPVM